MAPAASLFLVKSLRELRLVNNSPSYMYGPGDFKLLLLCHVSEDCFLCFLFKVGDSASCYPPGSPSTRPSGILSLGFKSRWL